MTFVSRDWRTILSEMISYISSNSPLSDINPGSVIATISEATSLEDAEQYFQMLEIIRNYSLNTTSGSDLDNRASEYNLEREEAKKSSTYVVIGDSAFVKVTTSIYSGLPGPKSGDTIIYGDDRYNFPTSSTLIIGRGTNNVETLSYSSIVEFSNYVRFDLSSALANDHGTDETIILSQGGNRVVSAGNKVKVSENDISAEVTYTIQNDVTLLDGEDELEDVFIVADVAGVDGNAPAGLINEFISLPFASASVINPDRVTNGKDRESDQELRDKIKLYTQSLSRGTENAILGEIVGLEDEDTNTRVVSANIIQTNALGLPSIVYIDDGTGFEPTYNGTGFETVITEATGGEKMLQSDVFPIVKAFVVSTNEEPFDMSGLTELIYSTNSISETVTFTASDFENSAQATAEEIARAINLRASLIESRTTDNGKKIFLTASSLTNENIQITGGTANDNIAFPTVENTTLFLYKNYRQLLSKDGSTASIESGNSENYSFIANDSLLIKIDGKTGHQVVVMNTLDTTAESVVSRVNLQLQGGTSIVSSNNIKTTIFSNTENSSESGIKIGRDCSVTSVSSDTIFSDVSLLNDFPYNNQLNGLRAYITSGTYSGNSQKIIAYNQLNGRITLDSSIGGFLSLGDTFVIDGLANGNIGNPSDTIGKLNFSTYQVSGKNKDYTLNRSQGQIELEDILQAGDIITAGTEYTKGQVVTNNTADYVFGVLSTLNVSIDKGIDQIISFSSGSYSAGQIVNIINDTLIGGIAYISFLNINKVVIETNQWSDGTGSIQITGGTSAPVFDFSSDEVASLRPHFPYLESQNKEDSNGASEYTFTDESNLVIVVDQISASPYTITMSQGGIVTLGGSGGAGTTFRDSSFVINFSNNDFFNNFFIKFTSGLNINEMDVISDYNGGLGEFTLTTGVSNAVSVSDTFVIIPRTAKNVSNFFQSTVITGLSLKAKIKETFDKAVIVSSLTPGSVGSINITGGTANNFSILFQTNGTALGTFDISNILGLMIGQEIKIIDNNTSAIFGFITNITASGPSGPYNIEIRDSRSGGSLLDLSNYTIDNDAYIFPRNLLNFPTVRYHGLDAYTYYTGLLQKVQWTIDGKEDDQENYPGVKAAGTQIEVKPPSTNRIQVVVDVTTIDGVSLSSIQEDIKSVISNYINNLGVSDDVIVSEITNVVMDVSGVYDVQVLEPSENIAVGDDEIVRVFGSDIIVG